MSDYMVKEVQKWYNQTYVGRTGYVAIDDDGIVGPGTCKALIRALLSEIYVPELRSHCFRGRCLPKDLGLHFTE